MIRFFEYCMLFIAVVLLQTLLFDHLHIGTFALVNISLLFVILLPLNTDSWIVMLASTALGIALDATMGLPATNTISLILIGYIRRPMIYLFLGNKDESKRGVATSKSVGSGRLITFILILVFIQNSIIFTLETMSTFDIAYTILRVISSTISSLFFVYILHLPLFRKVDIE